MNRTTDQSSQTRLPFAFTRITQAVCNTFNGKYVKDLTNSMANSSIANTIKNVYNWSEEEGLNTGIRITTAGIAAGGVGAIIGGLTMGPMGALIGGGIAGAVTALMGIGYAMATGETQYEKLCREDGSNEPEEKNVSKNEPSQGIISSIWEFFTADSVATQIQKGLDRAESDGVNLESVQPEDFKTMQAEYEQHEDSSLKLEDFVYEWVVQNKGTKVNC